MSINVLTWNIYFGQAQGLSPQQRLQEIFNIACNKNIDVIFLQEFNGNQQDVDNVLNNTTYSSQIISECSNKQLSPRASNAIKYYLIISNNNCIVNYPNHFYEDKFIYSLNRYYLRCPIYIKIYKDNKDYNFYVLHSEAWKEYAQTTINILERCIDPITQNITILGDLNLLAKDIPLGSSYRGFSDKLDHIITKNNCIQIDLGIYPKSDHHFPIAATIESSY